MPPGDRAPRSTAPNGAVGPAAGQTQSRNMPTPDSSTPSRSKRWRWVGQRRDQPHRQTKGPRTPIGHIDEEDPIASRAPSTSTPASKRTHQTLATPGGSRPHRPHRQARAARAGEDNGLIIDKRLRRQQVRRPMPWATRAAISISIRAGQAHTTNDDPVKYRPGRSK